MREVELLTVHRGPESSDSNQTESQSRKSPVSRLSSAKKRLLFYGGLILGIAGLYAYQPQRYDFRPKPAPIPNPAIEPNPRVLFSSKARVLIVTAHPDDTEFFLGGILTKFRNANVAVDELVCTDGDKSYYLIGNPQQLRRTRRQEQMNAAKASNVSRVRFLGYPDGRLFPNADVVENIRKEIEFWKPEYVIAFDGEYPPRQFHRDHLNSGIAAMEAIKGTRVTWAMLFATHAANYSLDVTDEWDRQQELLAIHRSQFSGEHLKQVVNMVESNAVTDGDRIGVTYAEGFRCVRLR